MTLTAGELSSLRAASDAELSDTCTIQRDTPASDGMGGQTSSWGNVATGVACRYYAPPALTGAAEDELAGRLAGVQRWTFTFTHDQDVTLADRIVVGARTFEVIAVDGERSWEIARRVHCVEVT